MRSWPPPPPPLQVGARRKHGGASAHAPPTLAVVGAGRGTLEQPVLMPPPGQCLSWVGELEGLFARELLLKTALVDGIEEARVPTWWQHALDVREAWGVRVGALF